MKDKILDKISPEEALEILKRLAKNNPKIAKQIEKEAEQLLKKIDLEEINDRSVTDAGVKMVVESAE